MPGIDEFRRRNPVVTTPELAAWLDSRNNGPRGFGGLSLVNGRKYTTLFVKSVSSAEEIFSIPVADYISAHNSDNGLPAMFVRYFCYVWIDATATSSIVNLLYTASLRQSDYRASRFNSMYPLLVTVLGTPLKLLLVAAAILALIIFAATGIVLGAVDWFVYIIGNRQPFEETLGRLGAISQSVLGIISTVAISNINPILLLKTLLVDPIMCMQIINKINQGLDIDAQSPDILLRRIGANTVSSIPVSPASDLTLTPGPIQEEERVYNDITATFIITNGIRNDVLADARKNFGYGYVLSSKALKWDSLNFYRQVVVEFEIHSNGVKNILATMQFKKIMDGNIISMQFTKEATDDDKHRISAGFGKMLEKITSSQEAAANKPNIEITNCDIASEVLKPEGKYKPKPEDLSMV